jgi:Leucine Rich repeat
MNWVGILLTAHPQKMSSRLRVLILSHNNITWQGLGALASLLENSDNLQHLGLVANKNILDNETKTMEFCNVLATCNRSLKTLDLSYCAACQAAAPLFRALQVNDTLRELDLSDSPFFGLGQKGRLQLEKSLPLFKGLRRLSVNWNFFHDVGLLKALQRNTSLHFLIARPGNDRHVQVLVGLLMQRNKALTMADALFCIKPTPQVLPPSLWANALERIALGNSQASSAVYRILRDRLADGM